MPGIGVLILGNSIFEGVGTALLIPPVYILTTLLFHDMKSRAWAFGAISGMGGIGAAAGPLIGGAITTAISWRVAFVFQALIIVIIVLLAGRLARRYRQRTLILAGFATTIAGIIVLLVMVRGHPGPWYFAPGLFLIGVGSAS